MIYKFRAECKADVENLLNLLKTESILTYKVHPDSLGLPDVEIEIEVDGFAYENYLQVIRKIEDGHVMLQTIQPIEKYTGERNYDLL